MAECSMRAYAPKSHGGQTETLPDYLRNRLINQTTNTLSLKGEGWGEGD